MPERKRMNDDVLKDARYILFSAATALTDVMEKEKSMAEACRDNGLDYKKFRAILQSKSFEEIRLKEQPLDLEAVVELEPNGYEQLYMDVFELKDIGKVKLPPDYKQTLIDILETLRVREKGILQMRYGLEEYGEPLTLTEIGIKLCITKDRVRQLEMRALRKLRHPSRTKWLTEGSIKHYAEQAASEAQIAEHQNAVNAWLAEQREKAKKEADNPETMPDLNAASITIEEMELSVRSYNVLKRAGKRTLQDVLEMTENDFMRTRNMGRKSMEEIMKRRNEMVDDIMIRRKMKEEARTEVKSE